MSPIDVVIITAMEEETLPFLERASAVGGTLQTGRDDGRFVVRAFLPSPEVRA